jgi:7-carboxy-7-deazaguanine synthase
MSIDAVVAEVAKADLPLVEVTGGEPLLQEAVYPLMEALLDRGHPVLLETSGAVSLVDVPAAVHKIVDMKAPGSGEVDKNHYPNLDMLTDRDELKIVVLDRADYDWALQLLADHPLVQERVRAVTFSPVHGDLEAAQLSAWMIEDRLDIRVGLQLHKIIWPGVEKGV